MRSLSVSQARRIAIGAQGLTGTRPSATPTRSHVRRALGHTGLFQIDSVNVLQRAHYLPAFSRLGPYDATIVDRMAFKHHELFEYWGHEAALLPVELHPLMRWRMAKLAAKAGKWGPASKQLQIPTEYLDWVYQEVADRGPIGAGEVAADEPRSKDNWGWNWTDAKLALEYLFASGRITTGGRRNFERLYDVPERVIPQHILAMPTPDQDAAHRDLLLRAARHHGVGTYNDLADYFRIVNAKPRIAELVENGQLEQVEVRGWNQPAYLIPGTTVPRRMAGRALLVPFDPLIWERDRTERLFGFHYRIEIYTPAPKRIYGYYVLPFLLGDALVGRVDLKADRAAKVLRVQAAWAEPDAPDETASELAAELRLMAQWLGLDDVVAMPSGNLSTALRAALDR